METPATVANAPSIVADSGVWLSPTVVAALLTLVGVVIGIIARDIWMASYLMRMKRADDLYDRKKDALKAHTDLVRLYADPLKEAVTSLRHRLHEIVQKKQAPYFLAESPSTQFFLYKRTSTLYRIAAVLGWIRAIRRERAYLDPHQAANSVEMEAISELEASLADGAHVELQRLDELSKLWLVPNLSQNLKYQVASAIDGMRAVHLAKSSVLSPRELSDESLLRLVQNCANLISKTASVEIPDDQVNATVKQAAVIFGIKEAYIYRDWQAAVGDLMLSTDSRGSRHFSVIGFGAFEDMYLDSQKNPESTQARWFQRLERLIHDLDVAHEGIFDARRDQLKNLYKHCMKLETALEARINN